MKNKDIHEWLLDEGIDPLTTVTTEKGEPYDGGYKPLVFKFCKCWQDK